MKRVVTPELLDEDAGTPAEIAGSLLDLYSFNQRLGGFSSMSDLVLRVAGNTGRKNLTLLDVAGGNGDVAEQIVLSCSKMGISARATVLDRAISHMKNHHGLVTKVAGDALSLPVEDGAYDVVGCNLFCHHLEPEEMVKFFNEALRVTRLAVIVSDLRRNLFHWLAAWVGQPIYRSRITRNDAPVSVRRAYTIPEISEIARRTTARDFEVRPYHFQRLGLILWKAAP